MNYRLAREIYGMVPWMVDGPTFATVFQMLKDFRNGIPFTGTGEKLNDLFFFDPKNGTRIISSTWELNQDVQGDDLIYVINLNGVITKNGGDSSYGTKHLSQRMLKFDADSRIKGGIILGDSGGGASTGIDPMEYAFENKKKPVVSLIERGGVSGSAAYGIMSMADYFMAESEHSIVGSLGTMFSAASHPHGTVDGDGRKHLTIYATKSTKKNLPFEEAFNNDNYELIINELLDPANERFLQRIQNARPSVKESQLDGSIYKAGDVIGSLVDEIGNFEVAVNKVMQLSGGKINLSNTNNNKNKTTAMTAQELLAQHPTVHAEIFGAGRTAGVAAEKDRTGAWMAHAGTDLEAVKKGITEGGEITATAREEFMVKANAKTQLSNLQSDSAKDIASPEADNKEVKPTEAQTFYADVLKGLK
jgi:ClpP class serine protease